MKKTKRYSGKCHGPRETAILERISEIAYWRGTHGDRLRLGIGDDAALFKGDAGNDQILTCDWFLEGTHFLRDKHPPDVVGWKCLARAVSDVAAMGGTPRCFLLSLALPATHTGRWLDQFLDALRRAAKRFGCVLAGGDTTRRKDILINITVLGEVRSGRAILRSGARPGDTLFASGRLGEAEFGLQLIRKSNRRLDSRDPVLGKHLYPGPRLAMGRWLADHRLPTAMMDLSDGLSTDLSRLCTASGVGARVELADLPTIRLRTSDRPSVTNPLDLALHGGDDYELLFTVPGKKLSLIPRSYKGVPITAIGKITKALPLLIIHEDGLETPLLNHGWDPFRSRRQE